MYLIDTNVISEARKGAKADPGVLEFLERAAANDTPLFLSAISVGELRRGIERVRRRGDIDQAGLLEAWMGAVLEAYADRVLAFDGDAAQVWGRLSAPDHTPILDKQIAAIALVNALTLVTRNTRDFAALGLGVLNPFSR